MMILGPSISVEIKGCSTFGRLTAWRGGIVQAAFGVGGRGEYILLTPDQISMLEMLLEYARGLPGEKEVGHDPRPRN